MHKRAFYFATSLIFAVVLSGCGGSGNSVNPPSINGGGGGQTQSLIAEDLFNLNGSQVLDTLELDAGFTATSSVTRQPESSVIRTQSAGPFAMQITGGNATIARSGTSTTPAIGFLMTFRDASGLCECSNSNPALPPPYKTNLTNLNWHASPFGTRASTTTLGIGFKNNVDSADHGGTYTATVNSPPGGSASFSIAKPTALGRQSNPTVKIAGGNVNVSWTPVAGSKTYFVAFLTHLNDDPVAHPGFSVVGFTITYKNAVSVPLSNFYSGAQYQVMLIDADQRYIPVYQSQGVQQLPTLPAQINFSVSQIVLFNTP
jgi:hypothetical protein